MLIFFLNDITYFVYSALSQVFRAVRCSHLVLRSLGKAKTLRRSLPWQGNAGLLGNEETTYAKGIKTRAKRKLKALSSLLPILACLVHLL